MFDLSNARFAFLDIETTGLSPWFGDRICQIAIVLTEGKRIKSTVDLLINPGRELSPAAAHINGLDESKLSAAPTFEEITDQLEASLKDAVIVCHNAKFDIQFLDNEYRKLGRSVEYPNLIDTLLLAREYFDLPSYSLHHLAEDFHVSRNLQGSRAQGDALTAKNLFFAMMDALKPNGKPLDDYIGIYNSPAWPEEGVYLPTELSEAINSGRRLFIKYMDKDGEISERWISPKEVIGLSDYIYLQAYCHTREADRTFRLDRIIEVAVEVGKE
ncbi:exonuclease domain-containing protein [Candidatus Villigracilis affinis]|uniref:exonuclease domain-containing protein n=1 Tax=Candidatus Villigracilis affinis TaxID=3140682 RepID=UPI002A19D654|nr:WYL domain-containing protein [Anaerolineales bacterium]